MAFVIFVYIKLPRKTLKKRVSIIARLFLVMSLILAMAGTSIVKSSKYNQLLVIADNSQSMQTKQRDVTKQVKQIQTDLPQDYKLAVMNFAKNQAVDLSFDSNTEFLNFNNNVETENTNIESAFDFAINIFDAQMPKHILLISDGEQNIGDASNAVGALKAQNIRVDVLKYEKDEIPDAQITKVGLPDIIYQGERFDINVTIDSTENKSGVLYLYGNRELIGTEQIQIQKGENNFVFEDIAEQSGMVSYEVLLEEEGGSIKNNKKSAVAKVIGAPTVLLLESGEGEARELVKMLKAVSINSQTLKASLMPADMGALQVFDSIALVNVDAHDFSQEQISTLDNYVATLGRTLVTFGGDTSYALGNYIGTGLEKMLPIECDVRNKLDMPDLSLVIIIDKSGSMLDGQYGITKLELAKKAAAEATEMLTENDQIGVIAFDDMAAWAVKLQKAENIQSIQNDIASIGAGGGTMMYSSLNEAYEALAKTNTKLKHVILLTDGQPADGGFDEVVNKMANEGITLSSVAVGTDANSYLMERLAKIGKGRFYQTDIFSDIPQIFAKETNLAMESYIQNREFYPVFVEPSPMTQTFTDGLPKVNGFLASVIKPTATLALESDNDMPILASWLYGTGTVVSWMSDVKGIWTEDYLAWNNGAVFFAGFISHNLNADKGAGTLTVESKNDKGEIILSNVATRKLETSATVISPNGDKKEIILNMVEPGKYSNEFDIDEDGVYVIQAEQKENGKIINSLESGMPVSYSAEFDVRSKEGMSVLQYLASSTGGKMIEALDELYLTPFEKIKQSQEVNFFLIALILLIVDIAVRRLQWEPLLLKLANNKKRQVNDNLTNEKKDKIKKEKAPKPKAKVIQEEKSMSSELLENMKNRRK